MTQILLGDDSTFLSSIGNWYNVETSLLLSHTYGGAPSPPAGGVGVLTIENTAAMLGGNDIEDPPRLTSMGLVDPNGIYRTSWYAYCDPANSTPGKNALLIMELYGGYIGGTPIDFSQISSASCVGAWQLVSSGFSSAIGTTGYLLLDFTVEAANPLGPYPTTGDRWYLALVTVEYNPSATLDWGMTA